MPSADTIQPRQQIECIRQIREHWRVHREELSCAWCRLWRSFIDRELRALDALIHQAPADEPQEVAHSDWGEAAWT